MAAFRRAVELGATFIETDLHLSRDAHLVAIHDATLERTTNGRGLVNSCTLAQLRELDAGSWFHPRFAGERIPTLDEIIRFGHENDVIFYLEIKPGDTWGVEHALVGALRESGETARSVVLSFELSTLAAARRLEPTLMAGFLFDQPHADAVECAMNVGVRQLAPRGDLVTPELVTAARRVDLRIVPWTINEPAHLRAMVAAGVDGIMTDYPDRLISILTETK